MKKITPAALRKACNYDSHILGKWFERLVEEFFKEFQETNRCRCIRLYDSHSAGSYLPAVDGDYIVVYQGTPFLIEAKCSAKHISLRSCLSSNVSKEQALSHRLFSRAGGTPLFLFSSVSANRLQVWDGDYVGRCRAKGAVLQDPPFLEGKLTDLEELMRTIFK